MRVSDIADLIGARMLCCRERAKRLEVERVYAGDRMSDVLGRASEDVLLLSTLATPHLVRVAGLMDAPGVCVVGGGEVGAELERAAARQGTVLMVSALDMASACERLSRYMPVERC